jgi:hypothetical protein
VLALLSVNQVELAPDEQREQRERVATTLESGLGEQGFAAVMRALRKRAEVEVLERNLRGEDG